MTLLTDIFNEELFESLIDTSESFLESIIKDPLDFIKKNGHNPHLNYADFFNAIVGRDRHNDSINTYRRSSNNFNDAYTAQSSMFCNSLASVLPTIQSSSVSRYL